MSANSLTVAPVQKKALFSPFIFLYLFLGSGLALVFWFNLARPIIVLPRITLAPGYSFKTAQGTSYNSEAQRGKITLYSFSYPACLHPQECAQSQADVQAVYQMLQQAQAQNLVTKPLSLITISLQPTDAGGAWANSSWNAESISNLPWTLLEGQAGVLKQVVGVGFGLYYAPKDGKVDFQTRYILVDALGIIRAYYIGSISQEIVFRDLQLLEKEANEATGALKIAYEAAHLFACYPR